jgi:hypothetical protein
LLFSPRFIAGNFEPPGFAFEIKYVPDMPYKQFESDGEEIDKMLNGYIAFLKESKQGANEPGTDHSIREDSASYFNEFYEDSTDPNETDH